MIRQLVLAALAAGISLVASVPAAQAEDGKALFEKNCGTCHSVKAGEMRQGPSLHGVVGRKAGKLEGFKYSAALAAADWTWNAEMLDKWITDPHDVLPDTVMMYQQDDPAIRAAIIGYLETQK